MEVYHVREKNLRMMFTDIKKAYDSVPRKDIWRMSEEKGNSY